MDSARLGQALIKVSETSPINQPSVFLLNNGDMKRLFVLDGIDGKYLQFWKLVNELNGAKGDWSIAILSGRFFHERHRFEGILHV